MSGLIIGIDATNLRQGGGLTHLIEFLRAAEPEKQGIDRVVLWGSKATLALLDERPWLEKKSPIAQQAGLLRRTLWQRFELSNAARATACDLLFVPGGSYAGDFHPVVTMNQNLLPFEWKELMRFGFSMSTLKYFVLRIIQSRSLRNVDGCIFLTEYAQKKVEQVTGILECKSIIVPHGIHCRFFIQPRVQCSIDEYSKIHPYRLLYVSIINQYKHQWQLIEAISKVRKKTGWPLVLDLVGPAYAPSLKRLQKHMRAFDPAGEWVHYHGVVPYDALHNIYNKADIAVWGSSCETFGMILLEYMAAGLPVASSDRGPMPEILGDAGIYFDPEQAETISDSLMRLIDAPELRVKLAESAYERAQTFSWKRCARDTFGFLADVYKNA